MDSGPTGGGQSQDNSMPRPEILKTTKIPVRPMKTSSSLLATQCLCEGRRKIIDLCASASGGSQALGDLKSGSYGAVPRNHAKKTNILSISKVTLEKGKKERPSKALPPGESSLASTKDQGSHQRVTEDTHRNIQSKTSCKINKGGNKAEVKPSTKTLKPIPRNNLVLCAMEPVQVLHPLGKSNVCTTMPNKKAPPITSSGTVLGKLLATAARPLPKPAPNELASSLIKRMPTTSLPKLPPRSLGSLPSHPPTQVQLPAPGLKPRPNLLKPLLPQVVPQLPVSCLTKMKSTAPHASVSQAQPHVVGRTVRLPPLQDSRRSNHTPSLGTMTAGVNLQPKILPRAHGVFFQHAPCPPVQPSEVPFSHWKPPPR